MVSKLDDKKKQKFEIFKTREILIGKNWVAGWKHLP